MHFLDIAIGAALVGLGWLGWLTVKHGWGWVLAKLHARAAEAEAAFKLKISSVTDPLEQRVSALERRIGIGPTATPQAPTIAPVSPVQQSPNSNG